MTAWDDLPEMVDRAAFLTDTRQGVCPFCGRDGLRAIGKHFNGTHDVTTDEVRARYGFNRGQSFSSADLQEQQSAIQTALTISRPDHLRKFLEGGRTSRGIAGMKARPQLLDKKRRLTSEQRAEIVRLYEGGTASAAIARLFGEHTTYIAKVLRWEGAKAPDKRRTQPYRRYILTVDQEADIVRRVGNGEKQSDLATEYGISRQMVQWVLRRAGVRAMPRRTP